MKILLELIVWNTYGVVWTGDENTKGVGVTRVAGRVILEPAVSCGTPIQVSGIIGAVTPVPVHC